MSSYSLEILCRFPLSKVRWPFSFFAPALFSILLSSRFWKELRLFCLFFRVKGFNGFRGFRGFRLLQYHNDLTMFSYIVHPNWNLSNPFPNQLMSPYFLPKLFRTWQFEGCLGLMTLKKSMCLSCPSSCTVRGQDYLGLVLRVSLLSSISSFVGITCYLVLM